MANQAAMNRLPQHSWHQARSARPRVSAQSSNKDVAVSTPGATANISGQPHCEQTRCSVML